MRYMFLIHSAPGAGPVPGTPAFEKLISDYHQVTGAMKEQAPVLALRSGARLP